VSRRARTAAHAAPAVAASPDSISNSKLTTYVGADGNLPAFLIGGTIAIVPYNGAVDHLRLPLQQQKKRQRKKFSKNP